MRVVNGWLIADGSKFGNFHRILLSSIIAFNYYHDSTNENDKNNIFIRFTLSNRKEPIDVYYETKDNLNDAVNELDMILWEHALTETQVVIRDS